MKIIALIPDTEGEDERLPKEAHLAVADEDAERVAAILNVGCEDFAAVMVMP